MAQDADPNADPSGLRNFFESLATVDLFYWRGKEKPVIHTIPLLLAGGVLIGFTRAIFFGLDDTLVTTIGAFSGFLILCVSSGAAIVRRGAEIPHEIYKLAHTISTTLLLALALLAPSILTSLQWWENWEIQTHWPIAMVYAAVATLLLLVRSCRLSLPMPSLVGRILPPLFIFVVTTVALNTVIMDVETDQFFRENAEKITSMLGSAAIEEPRAPSLEEAAEEGDGMTDGSNPE